MSIHRHTKVLLNKSSCFPEVAGNAALYFDIKEDGNLYEVFDDFYMSSAIQRNVLKEKARLQLEKYSWEKSAMLLDIVYKSIL